MIDYHKDEQDIVTLTLDAAGRKVNLIDRPFMAALATTVDRLAADSALAGVIVVSAKPTFIAGADLRMIYEMADAAAVFQMVEDFKAALRQLETLGRPVVMALNGTAVGGGFELALAGHYRLAIDDPHARYGLPEVTLGLLPGGGGVTRLVRMLGLQAAFPLLTEGKRLPPARAKEAGLVDELAPDRETLLARAREWVLDHPDAVQPWDRRGYRLPGGDPRQPRVAQMAAMAPAMIRQKTRGNYPAPTAILNTAVQGALVDFETASRIESRHFAQIVTGQVAKNMLTAFWFQRREIEAGQSRPADYPRREVQQVGVLGAGMMGHGIAYVSALAGLRVALKDVDQKQAAAGKGRIEKLLAQQVDRGRMTVEEKTAVLERITPTGRVTDLQGCDLVVEAVFEDRGLKAQVTRETEAQLAADAIFASNTSTLPITSLAQESARPQNFIGLHFFSPVHKMKLVEIIVGAETADGTLARAFDYVLQIGKTPIVVNDSRGFYTSRVFMTYVMEGMALLAEGQLPRAIESAGMQAGMPVGPLAVTDEINLGLAWQIREQTRRDLSVTGEEFVSHPADAVLDYMVNEAGRPGRAQGAGFYDYPAEGEKRLWSELAAQFPSGDPLSQREMMDRLLFVQALETARCLDEGVLRSVADANLGSIFGWGFAPFHGGALQFINAYGVPAFVARSQALADRYGGRFAPPTRLVQMAAAGGRLGARG